MSTNPSHSHSHSTSTSSAAPPLAGGAPGHAPTHGAGATSGAGSTVPGTHSGTVPAPAESFPSSTTSGSGSGSAPATGTGPSSTTGTGTGATPGSGTGTGPGKLSSSEAQSAAIPGHAGMDPEIPKSASEAPVFGVEGGKEVPFGEQVKGHAKYFAGKVFGKDHEVQQGAARVRGESHTLPEEVKHPSTKQAEAEAQGKGATGATGGL